MVVVNFRDWLTMTAAEREAVIAAEEPRDPIVATWLGVAGENLETGDLVMIGRDGKIYKSR